MGSRPVPPYANIFLGKKIDPKILKIAEKYSKNCQIPITSLKRFWDDLFSNWYGFSKDLPKFFEKSI